MKDLEGILGGGGRGVRGEVCGSVKPLLESKLFHGKLRKCWQNGQIKPS